jgi:rhodanese-related sulfurtransferase
MKNETRTLLKEIAIVISLSLLLAFVYNAVSRKGIPLIRKEVKKVTVSDSVLFPAVSGTEQPNRYDTSDIPVIAPLHEKALKNPDSMAALYAPREEHSIRVINLSQFMRMLGENKAIVIDARGREEYEAGHIGSAWNVPALEVDQYFEKFSTLPRDTLIIIYCNNPDCHMSRMVGDFLQVMGFSNMYHYDGGWDEWEKKQNKRSE